MKRIIDGKKYDTTTATKLAFWDNGHNTGDFHYCEETLYRTKRGAFFIYGEGGALSTHGSQEGNDRGYGFSIQPVSEQEARVWCEEREIPGEKIESIFGAIEEAEQDEVVMVGISSRLRDRLKARTAERGEKMKTVIERLIEEYLK